MNKILIEYQGQKLSIKEIARLNGVNFRSLANKYRETRDIDEAVEVLKEVQMGPRKYVDFFGQKMTINQIAKMYGIRWGNLDRAYKLTSNIDEAVSICINDNFVGQESNEKVKIQKNTVSIDKLTNLDKNSFPETSLKSNDHTLLNNNIDSIELVEKIMLANDIKKAMETMPLRESKVLRLRFGLDDGNPLILSEVAKIIGVSTKERVRQIEEKALRRLRCPKKSKHLADYIREESENKIKKTKQSLLSELSEKSQ